MSQSWPANAPIVTSHVEHLDGADEVGHAEQSRNKLRNYGGKGRSPNPQIHHLNKQNHESNVGQARNHEENEWSARIPNRPNNRREIIEEHEGRHSQEVDGGERDRLINQLARCTQQNEERADDERRPDHEDEAHERRENSAGRHRTPHAVNVTGTERLSRWDGETLRHALREPDEQEQDAVGGSHSREGVNT